MLPKEITSIQDIIGLVAQGFNDRSQYGDVKVIEQNGIYLFNYTNAAQYANRWNFFETVSRGLIVNKTEVVARPFDKFFNFGEFGKYPTGHLVSVTDKVDGSLGILYRDNGCKIATRGSFTSDQALWATEYLNENWNLSELPYELTMLFEIVYPDNKIVVDYHGAEDLVLLAMRNPTDGRYIPFYEVDAFAYDWGFTRPTHVVFNNITQILEATGMMRDQEGFVAEFSDGSRWKFKTDWYRELHKFISGISFKNTLKAYENGKIDEYMKTAPEEYREQVREWYAEIVDRIMNCRYTLDMAYDEQAPKTDRKTFAQWVMKNYPKGAACLFDIWDQKPDWRKNIIKLEFYGDNS
jgi:RNA ligase